MYHSAEDTASGSDKERSTPSSVSSLDDEARQLYELTQSRLLKSYTVEITTLTLTLTLSLSPRHTFLNSFSLSATCVEESLVLYAGDSTRSSFSSTSDPGSSQHSRDLSHDRRRVAFRPSFYCTVRFHLSSPRVRAIRFHARCPHFSTLSPSDTVFSLCWASSPSFF